MGGTAPYIHIQPRGGDQIKQTKTNTRVAAEGRSFGVFTTRSRNFSDPSLLPAGSVAEPRAMHL